MTHCCSRLFGAARAREDDDGEWIEPIRSSRTRSRRHSARITWGETDGDDGCAGADGKEKEKAARRRSSISSDDLRKTNKRAANNRRTSSVQWADLIANMDQWDASDLDDPKLDCAVYKSVNNSSEAHNRSNGLNVSMGSKVTDDSIMQSLRLRGSNSSTRGRGGMPPRLVSDLSRADFDGENSLDGNADSIEEDAGGGLGENSIEEGNINPSGDGLASVSRREIHSLPGKTKLGRQQIRSLFKKASGLKNDSSLEDLRDVVKDACDIHRHGMSGLLRSASAGTISKVDISGMKRMFSLKRASSGEISPSPGAENPAITSIAVLGDGYFLTASRYDKSIKMFKHIPFEGDISSRFEFVKEFTGHGRGTTALVTLDEKGRFLSAGFDKKVMLWDSRFNCEDDPEEEEEDSRQEPQSLLATFRMPDRYVHSIVVLDEGSYVRPTDDVDIDMVTAMAKKTVLEGAAAVQRAAVQRETIECSGSFVTASKNCGYVDVWKMAVVKKNEEDICNDVCEISLAHKLEHDAPIKAIAAERDMIVTGDAMGIVWLWQHKKRWSHVGWEKLCKFSRSATISSHDEAFKRSITSLCFIQGVGNTGTPLNCIVSGSKGGKVRVWDISKASTAQGEVKRAITSLKVTSDSGSLSGIEKLPSFQDPNTGADCLAFSAATTNGHVISMAVYPRDHELVMFHVYDHSSVGDDPKEKVVNLAINSIAVDTDVVITGDGTGGVHLLKPKWSSDAENK